MRQLKLSLSAAGGKAVRTAFLYQREKFWNFTYFYALTITYIFLKDFPVFYKTTLVGSTPYCRTALLPECTAGGGRGLNGLNIRAPSFQINWLL